MRFSVALRCGALCALLILPVGVDAKTIPTTVSGAENDPQTPTPAADAPSFKYLGQTFALDTGCAAEWFVVDTHTSVIGSSATVILAVPYPGGLATLPPQEEPATAANGLAGKSVSDTVCLNPPPS